MKPTSVKLPNGLAKSLDLHCKFNGVGRSAAIRMMVADGLWRQRMNRYGLMAQTMKRMGVYDEMEIINRLMINYLTDDVWPNDDDEERK
jgi:metal-responsive CopG/Arc/MetJ family transcriptional regulator